jgi:hypothetical protein
MIMCKYNYAGIRCANIDIEDRFCVGERNCNLSDIMDIHSHEAMPRDRVWQAIPRRISELGKY